MIYNKKGKKYAYRRNKDKGKSGKYKCNIFWLAPLDTSHELLAKLLS